MALDHYPLPQAALDCRPAGLIWLCRRTQLTPPPEIDTPTTNRPSGHRHAARKKALGTFSHRGHLHRLLYIVIIASPIHFLCAIITEQIKRQCDQE